MAASTRAPVRTPPTRPTTPQIGARAAPGMALAAENVFEEHLGVIEALKDNYTRQDDAAAVAGVNGLREELAQLCAAREDEVKAAIRGAR